MDGTFLEVVALKTIYACTSYFNSAIVNLVKLFALSNSGCLAMHSINKNYNLWMCTNKMKYIRYAENIGPVVPGLPDLFCQHCVK